MPAFGTWVVHHHTSQTWPEKRAATAIEIYDIFMAVEIYDIFMIYDGYMIYPSWAIMGGLNLRSFGSKADQRGGRRGCRDLARGGQLQGRFQGALRSSAPPRHDGNSMKIGLQCHALQIIYKHVCMYCIVMYCDVMYCNVMIM